VTTQEINAAHFIAISIHSSVTDIESDSIIDYLTFTYAVDPVCVHRIGTGALVEPLDVLGDVDIRATLLFARSRPRPVTAGEVASNLGISKSVARWRLERLAAAGLLTTGFEHRSGPPGPGGGRPAKTYAVAPETEAIEFPARHYEELLALLIEALPRQGRAETLADVGVSFGRQLANAAKLRPATRPRTAFERICRALGKLGFQTSLESLTVDGAVLTTPTCPLRPLVMDDKAARAIDSGMWRALVSEALLDTPVSSVVCDTHDCLGDSPCRILVTMGRTRR
jgi:predicted ArsR family transcriptional regulator